MRYVFVDESWEDYLYWQKTDKKKLKRINDLLNPKNSENLNCFTTSASKTQPL